MGKQLLIHNPVAGQPRVGSGLKNDYVKPAICVDKDGRQFIAKEFPATPQAHGFIDIIDNYSIYSSVYPLSNGANLYQVEG